MDVIFCNPRFRAGDKVHGNNQEWFFSKRTQLLSTLNNHNYDYVIFDTAPGLHLFTINILSFANNIFLITRSDLQSYEGTQKMLEDFYAISVGLSSSDTFALHLILNQIPNVDEMEPLLDKWTSFLSEKYEFITKYLRFPYNDQTGYLTALNKFVLPQTNLIKQKMESILKLIEN